MEYKSVRLAWVVFSLMEVPWGTVIGRANRVSLGDGSTSFTGSGGGGILGTGTITVAANSTTNDGNAATLVSNGAFLSSVDTTTNVLANTLDLASGRVLRVDTPRGFNLGDAAGDLTGAGRIVKITGANSGLRELNLNFANTGVTGTVEIQDGQVATRVTDALGTNSTVVFNSQNNANGVGLYGAIGATTVSLGSTLQLQRTTLGNQQFITTSGGSTFNLNGNFSNTGMGLSGLITVGRGSGSYAYGVNSGVATVGLNGTGSLENNIAVINGATATSALSLGNTTGTQTFTGVISGNGALVRNGLGGTTILSNANTYSGTTTVSAGSLVIAGNHTGAGQIVVNNAGVLQFGNGSSLNGSSVNSGTIFVNNTGTVQLNKTDGGTLTNAVASNPSATTTLSGTNAAGTTNTFTATSFSNGGGFATNSTNTGAILAFSSASGAIDLKGTSLTVDGAGDTLLTSAGQGFYSSTTTSNVSKNGTGTLIYQGNQGYTGTTAINAGAVRVDIAQTNGGTYFVGNGGTTTTAASLLLGGGAAGLTGGVTFNRAVTVNPGSGGNPTLGGTNTFSANVNFAGPDNSGQDRSITLTAASGGTVDFTGGLTSGGIGVGQNVRSSVTYDTGSIFEWNLAAVPSETGRSTSYDAVSAASLGATTGAIFRVVLNGAQNFTESFWDTDRTWSEIFKTSDGGSALSIASIFSGAVQYYNGGGSTLASISAPATEGAFTFNGSSLNWTAVPEPSSALAGLLLASGLLRRWRA